MPRDSSPPEQVTLVYRRVGDTHVFTAPELPGLHVGSSSQAKAFEQSIKALGEHVSQLHGCTATYTVEMSFAMFKQCLAGENAVACSFVTAKKAEHALAA